MWGDAPLPCCWPDVLVEQSGCGWYLRQMMTDLALIGQAQIWYGGPVAFTSESARNGRG